MGAPLAALDLYRLVHQRCDGDPLSAEWGEVYDTICQSIALIGPNLDPGRDRHQLPVVAAAVHYVRESFQSEGRFWQGFMADVGIANRNPLFETIYNWFERHQIPVLGDQRREVVQTLLAITGVPAHWSRDFADFFRWYFRSFRSQPAEEVWSKYPGARRMAGRENSFIPTANKLNRVFQYLMEEGVDPESNPADASDEIVELFGPEYDPRRLVRRQDSFLRLWRELYDRLTPGRFRGWLRSRPDSWLTLPNGKAEAARRILMADEIEFGTYLCEGAPIEVVPHPKVSLHRVLREWSEDTPWLELSHYVGYRSKHSFEVRRTGEPYGMSRPFTHEGVRCHIAMVPLPLGGYLEFPRGTVSGLEGINLPPHDLWLQRSSSETDLYLVVPHLELAVPSRAQELGHLEILCYGVPLDHKILYLDRSGWAEMIDWRVKLPEPRPAEVTSRFSVAGEVVKERSTLLPRAMLFTPSGDMVRPRKRAAAFGERRYTLILAEGEEPPEYDADTLVVTWQEQRLGAYRVADVRWKHGPKPFRLAAGDNTWEFERGLELDLWVTSHRPAQQPGQAVTLQLPPNAVESLEQFEIRLVSSGSIEAGQLALHLFRANRPLDALAIGPKDLIPIRQSAQGLNTWNLSRDWLDYLTPLVHEPGMYDLALATSDTVVSRFRFYLIPRVRVQKKLPVSAERSRLEVNVQSDKAALLHQSGQLVSELQLPVHYRVHEVSNPDTGVRCYPETSEVSLTFAEPQLTATLAVVPRVCGLRPLIHRHRAWVKESNINFSDLSRGGIYLFGPPGVAVMLIAPSGIQLKHTRLDDEGHGFFNGLSELRPYCQDPVSRFRVQIGTVEIPFCVNRAPEYRRVSHDTAISAADTLAYSMEISGPSGARLNLVLATPDGRELSLQEVFLDGRSGWKVVQGTIPGKDLAHAAHWRFVLLTGGQRHLLGKVWSIDRAAGGIGSVSNIPVTTLPDRVTQEVALWLAGRSQNPLVVWAPVALTREKCVERVSAICPRAIVHSPAAVQSGVPITEDLLYPEEAYLEEGVAVPSGMAPEDALRILREQPQPPMLIPEAQLLSAYERSVLKQLGRKVLLIADGPLQL